jgi:3-oxo-5alpha-steroid 4-dehydrogenase
MFKYLMAEGCVLSPATLRRFCEDSNANLEWLEAHGVPYGGNAYLNKTAYPPDGYSLYFSGNEMVPFYKERAKPAPRGHRTAVPGFGGHVYYAKLKQSALAGGVRLLLHAPVQRLIVDERGRVIGVEVNRLPEALWKEHDALYDVVSPWKPFNGERAERAIAQCDKLEQRGTARRIRARGGVILCTGGFTYNLDLIGRYRKEVADSYTALLRLGSMGCDGSGIELGLSVGGKTAFMDRMFLGRPISPPEAFLYGLMVNAEGRRFINEDAYQSLFGEKLAEQSGNGTGRLILDHEHFWRGIKQSIFPGKGMFMQWGAPALMNVVLGGTKWAGSLRMLATKCGMDTQTLERTIAEFNFRAETGVPDPFGKAADKIKPLVKGPYYAINVSLNNKFGPTFTSTLGGLVPNEDTGEVQTEDGSPIEGLYAAGRSAIGFPTLANASGLSIADTVFSGRRAARHAAGRAIAVTA